MIRSFRDKGIEKVWARERAPKVPSALQRPAKRKLLILDAADSLQDLRVPLGKPSEKLTPARQGHYSVPLDDTWRVSFRWKESDAYVVAIVDHRKRPGGVIYAEEKTLPHSSR